MVKLPEDVLAADATRFFWWDRDGHGELGGIAESSSLDGKLIRSRVIKDLNINGAPRSWNIVPGGYLANWDEPTFIRQAADGALSVGWKLPSSGSWQMQTTSILPIANTSFIATTGPYVGTIARRALSDGHLEWSTPLADAEVQSLGLTADATTIYADWVEYSATAPTPTITIPHRVRAFDLATGKLRWTYDFTDDSRELAVSNDTIIAALNSELLFIDGPTGRVFARIAASPSSISKVLIDGDHVYAGFIWESSAVVAFDRASGKQLWRSPLTLDDGVKLAVVDDSLIVTTPSHSVASLDLATGAIRWDVGVGVDAYHLFASRSAIVYAGSGRAAGFALPPNAPLEHATFHGKLILVRCGTIKGALMNIGNTVVHVDDDGSFRATIDARGSVVVGGISSGGDREHPDDVTGAVIHLNGSGDYAVPDLTGDQCERG